MPNTLIFQTDLDRIVHERPPLLLRLTTLALASLLAGVLLLANVTRVDIVITGHGHLAADQPTNMVMPFDRAILRTLNVRAGDVVRRGQVLATLDGTFARADMAALQAQAFALTAETVRLYAEMNGGTLDMIPGPDGAIQAILFDQRHREYEARLVAFDQALAHDQAEMATARHQIESLRHQVAVAREVIGMRAALMQRAAGSRLQFLDADATLSRAAGAQAATEDRLGELGHLALAHAADRSAFVENWRREVVDQLASVRTTQGQVLAALRKTVRINDLVTVTAPEDGIVLEVASRGPGAVLREAEPLLTLLPSHAALIAEITVKSVDIGGIRAGDNVRVKIDAYPYQMHGALDGHVRSVAAASFEEGGEASAMHRVVVALEPARLVDLPSGTGPMPGMTVAGDVHVGTRTVLAYFLAPITRGFAQSLHEP
jgi:HlyD family secretion protein